MGLDASIICNCYKEGHITPPPVPDDLICTDAEGYLPLSLPYKGNEDKHTAFDNWLRECCEHPRMNYARARIANWAGYHLFQQVLSQAGREHFPVLKAELPERNGGLMSADVAARALLEIEYFKHHADLGTNTFLINTETAEVIRSYIETYQGKWVGSKQLDGVEAGFDRQGFFIASGSRPPHEFFRSMRFEQRLHQQMRPKEEVEYIDLESGQRFVCNIPIRGKNIPCPDGRMQDDRGHYHVEHPRYLHVEERKLEASYFSYILDPLTEVFQAAIATGNPVRWC